MLARVFSCVVIGLEGVIVKVEVDERESAGNVKTLRRLVLIDTCSGN